MNTETALSSMSRISKGYIICVVGTIIWSSTAVFIRHLNVNYQMPALVVAFWRDLIVCAAMGIALWVVNTRLLHIDKIHTRFILAYGVLLSLFNLSWTFSVAFNGAAVSTVLAYSSAAYTALLAWRFFHERLDLTKLFIVTMCLFGCALVSGALDPSLWKLNPYGIITGLISGVAFAAYSMMGKVSAHRGLNSWSVLFYTFGVAAILLLFYNIITDLYFVRLPGSQLLWLGSSLAGWLVLTALAIGPTIGGYGLYTLSLSFLPVSIANLIATMEPAMTALLAYFFLGEMMTPLQWIGSVFIIGSVIVLRLSEGREHE